MRAAILGGTSGIGLAAAHQLTGAGIDVVVTGRDPQRLAAARAAGLDTRAVDATSEADLGALFDEIGTVDHLVLAFSPGPAGLGPIADVDTEGLRTALLGKPFAYLVAIKQARVRESITMVSAATARSAMPGTSGLAAANGAVERMVPPLAAELAPIRVNAVAPGVVDTPWWEFLPPSERSEQFAALSGQLPAGRVGTAQDLGAAIGYLVTAPYVTGTVLAVDGGATAA